MPQHIAIIMDGNGRWAKRHALMRYAGHLAGVKAIEPVVLHCNSLGVKVLTLYAFSTENWSRSKREVSYLMKLFYEYLKKMDTYLKYNIQLKFLGDCSAFDEKIQNGMKEAEKKFIVNDGMVLAIAVNYGGRDEIFNAAIKIAEKVKNGEIEIKNLTKKLFEQNLYTNGLPSVDLLIRTGGEFRISNFLLWQSAYAELVFFDDVLWPSFKPKHIDFAVGEYFKRNRTYGGRSSFSK